jgi:hypothetical protein
MVTVHSAMNPRFTELLGRRSSHFRILVINSILHSRMAPKGYVALIHSDEVSQGAFRYD